MKTRKPALNFADVIQAAFDDAADKVQFVESLREWIHVTLSPIRSQPVDWVRWVPISQVSPNDYNPNSVAAIEMKLLYVSIKHDGYTQPIVTVWNGERRVYEIVDGFHRYYTALKNADILARNHGRVPIVVIDKDINDRMASTVRHNRARGKHSVRGMSSMVFAMLENGWEDAAICNELGMEPEELLRLKHITGFSKLFENAEYQKAWLTKRQVEIKAAHEARGKHDTKSGGKAGAKGVAGPVGHTSGTARRNAKASGSDGT
jgi:ParB-like chromosome segregation protein Spo0J